MNSTVVGSLSPAWRSATWTISGSRTRQQHNSTSRASEVGLRSWERLACTHPCACGHQQLNVRLMLDIQIAGLTVILALLIPLFSARMI